MDFLLAAMLCFGIFVGYHAQTAAANYQCHTNEEYVNCFNVCNTCWASSYCRTPLCEPGCDCRQGYLRNSYGECVTAYECSYSQYDLPPQCDINEVYTSCVNVCNDCISRGRCGYLSEYCTSGCDCRLGFLRNERGVCVPEWNCPNQRQPVCPPDEQHYDCIPKCRVTCDSYNNPNFICDTSCTKGCFCKPGLLRNSDGRCVLPRDCPVRNMPCPVGEAFYQCLPTCRTTCKSVASSSGICSTECRSGCFCQPGFVRNDFGLCVRPQECPTSPSMSCPPDEVFYNCIPCNTCEGGLLSCNICRPGCYCGRGLVRRRDGQCVRETDCRTVCGLNEEYLSCGSACPATCDNFNESRFCTMRCIRGCFCMSGFVLGSNGSCIQPQNCPLRLTTPRTGGIDSRGGGSNTEDEESETTTAIPTTDPKKDVSKNESTVMPSSENSIPTTSGASTETQTEISNVSMSNSTDQLTTTNITDATTVQQLETTSPLSTEKVTQTVPLQTSQINNSSESTSLPTKTTETSKPNVTGGGTVQTTAMVTTISAENATSSNPIVKI